MAHAIVLAPAVGGLYIWWAVLGYVLHCCYCSVHVVVVSRCIVDTVECMYRVVNSTYRVHDIWVHMR